MKKQLIFAAVPHRTIAFLILFIFTLSQVYSQISFEECRTPVFWTGEAAPTYCSKTGPNPPTGICGITLGTTIHHSSQLPSNVLTGIVCITGNFSITTNTDFTFQDAIVYIAPNVEILVEDGAELFLDNASLHGCDGLWRGIRLLEGTQIHTSNNTLIEDAQLAISAKFVTAALFIENTIFNRNITGIWLEHNPFTVNPPFIAYLSNSTFRCDGPIIGSNDISTYGIFAHNIPVIFFTSPDVTNSSNLFRGLKYGIKVEGQPSILKCNQFVFREIYYSCIEVEIGEVEIRNSTFLNYGDDGIVVSGLHKAKIEDCNFQIAEVSSSQFISSSANRRSSIRLSSAADFLFPLEVKIEISRCTLTYACPSLENEFYTGIQLNLFLVNRKILIKDNNHFGITGLNAHGIYIFGSLNEPSRESYDIYNNRFIVGRPNSSINGNTTGINVVGTISNMHIVENYLTGLYQEQDNNNLVSFDYGIKFSVQGTNNKIVGNQFNFDFFARCQVSNSPMVNICSNISGICRGFYFQGDNLGTNFNRNEFYGATFDIQGSITGQSQKDNKFYPISSFFGTAARCITGGNCAFTSRFEVRQPLGSEYYPDAQICGTGSIPCLPGEEFFINTSGPQSPDCADEFQVSGDLELMLAIAQNEIPNVEEYPTKRFFFESWLYQMLISNPNLATSSAHLANFLIAKSTTTVGQFSNIDNLILAAVSSSTSVDNQILNLANTLENINLQIEIIDQQLNNTISNSLIQQKLNLINSWQSSTGQLNNLTAHRNTEILPLLQNIASVNNSIVVTTINEINQKSFNTILIEHLINGDSFSENESNTLSNLSEQCIQEGGIAVIRSFGLLENCKKQDFDFQKSCDIEYYPPLSMPTEERNDTNKHETSLQKNEMLVQRIGDEILVFLPNDFEGLLSLTDVRGRLLFNKRLFLGESVVKISINSSEAGVFFISARSLTKLYSKKLFVIR